ncbi:Inactive leucine-rich repeat receptor-like protein kinase CORYNE [Camellia lanceoleosa]|uniref:Inactive leucine-rich repeat receptor-like protein kinase CORYNE n=1 Tax=Camellia lanceoleosa TaxID=1840588 RepID=A0ACC0HRM4_9ERIC|nr:Inactive leucine-rich repeat receptor-like protein kinase CORYNE [Camellia lanceoleosa]
MNRLICTNMRLRDRGCFDIEIPFAFRPIPVQAVESTGTQVLEQILRIMLPCIMAQGGRLWVGYAHSQLGQSNIWLWYTDKSDIFSFVVILCVLLTGRDPMDTFFGEVASGGSLGRWLRHLQQAGEAREALDMSILGEEVEEDEILMAVRIAPLTKLCSSFLKLLEKRTATVESGKVGAIVGAFGFLYAAQNQDPTKTDKGYPSGIGVRNALMVVGGVNFLGMVFTFLVPKSKGKSLEEISQENEEDEDGSTEMRQ